MAEGDASEGLLSRLGLRRGLASKVPGILLKRFQKISNSRLKPLKQRDFFEATQISAT